MPLSKGLVFGADVYMDDRQMDKLVEWLLEGPPWVQYRTRLDLLGQSESDSQVRAARQEMITHPQVQGLLAELTNWPGTVVNSHKSAGQPFHKLAFVADLGLRTGDREIETIGELVLGHQSPQGPFQLPMNISPSYGGSGENQWAWALCDAPIIVYALIKFGLAEDARVQLALQYLVGVLRENGWPCAVSPELGKFRGPGRKSDPCPYANLVMLKALSQTAEWRDHQVSHIGAETLLTLWEQSRERHPYMFFMGTDFRKLKAPLIWYDILHVLDVLRRFSWLQQDARLQQMVGILETKADEQGRFTPESVWGAWKEWDFGQKREPSRWLTLLAQRILKQEPV